MIQKRLIQTKLGFGLHDDFAGNQYQLGHFGSSSRRRENSSAHSDRATYNNSPISREEFISKVVKLRRQKAKDKNVAENGDYIVRRFDIPEFEKQRHNFNINDWMPCEKFKELTLECEKIINKKGQNSKLFVNKSIVFVVK